MTEGRDRGSQHCSGAAVGPAMIRRQEQSILCGVRQALVCRELYATGMPSCETGDSSEHLLHLTISNIEANGDLTTDDKSGCCLRAPQRSSPTPPRGKHSNSLGNVHQSLSRSIFTHWSFSIYQRYAPTIATPLHGNSMWDSWPRWTAIATASNRCTG